MLQRAHSMMQLEGQALELGMASYHPMMFQRTQSLAIGAHNMNAVMQVKHAQHHYQERSPNLFIEAYHSAGLADDFFFRQHPPQATQALNVYEIAKRRYFTSQ